MASRRVVYLTFIILFFLISSHFLGWIKYPEIFLNRISLNVSGSVRNYSQGVGNFFQRWTSTRGVYDENNKLRNQIADLLFNRSELEQLKAENDSLRAQLNFAKSKNKFTLANVTGKVNELSSNIIIIDKGSNYNIRNGKPVVANDGILIGKIIKVENNSSLVRLLSDSQNKIGGTVLNNDKTIGVVSGEYNLGLKLTMIPLTETVNPGDLLITSGLETDIPRGLLIGQIENVQKELYQPFQRADIKPAIDFSKISIVSVITE